MKLFNGIMILVFGLCVIVQINDPNPLQWVLVYGLAVVACIIFYTSVNHVGIPLLVGALAMLRALALMLLLIMIDEPIEWGSVFMQSTTKTQVVEWVREIGGLLIVVAWMAVLFVQQKKKNKAGYITC